MTRFGQRNVSEVTCHLWQGVSRTSAKFATHSLLPACMAVKASVTVGTLSVWSLRDADYQRSPTSSHWEAQAEVSLIE